MASGEASFRRQLTDSFKAAIQELRDEKGARDGTFASSLEKLVGSVRHLPFVWGNPQVAKEPHWWLLMLLEKEYEAANIVDDHGLHGKVTQGLALSLLEGHRRAGVPCNDHVKFGFAFFPRERSRAACHLKHSGKLSWTLANGTERFRQ